MKHVESGIKLPTKEVIYGRFFPALLFFYYIYLTIAKQFLTGLCNDEGTN